MATTTDLDVNQQISPDYIETVICFNVKMLLASKGLNQTDLAKALDMSRSAASYKLSGKSVWSVPDLVIAANFLNVHVEDLLSDALMKQLQGLGGKRTAIADVWPRFFVLPDNQCPRCDSNGGWCPRCDSNARHPL